ncbi:50S ribosomal protein L24 [Candidatus Kuenenbacteria bacterium CG23_combo_of_CG06-09_8_20_14_all_36_9]|uniref:Large ribosomal subunit protein uL24 n=1 Tax=Candidatus Kuenenbacteria bacterium CG10_big_fil_rev_8_21_14_0_10_36_11 TaxID=1974618 RepID=A0A2M6W9S1_9BACT|nr:MAG: 50S ribosomal protein L24 [Candidatus Kuenenbacteria bacterium CG23_combo_of_CG06-09_8_20_14_all_36_9]PIT89543.1 MAG: 50S ribosomal protein L24 [Candidatus Kuenenbacteria bacterium CG10_big_fil_rev_8_21_14_0_10_36_11]
MKIKKNDQVKIMAGKDRGKSGRILQVLKNNPEKIRVVVEGLNLKFKHLKPKRGNEKGQRIMFPAPLNSANVQLICPKCGQTARIGYKIFENRNELTREKKQRICKKCQAVI